MGYLDEYGESSWGFNRVAKAAGAALLAAIIGYCFYWLFFRNWAEERRVERFLEAVRDSQYEQAYEMWGCAIEEPCRDYSYERFLEDWGPDSPLGEVRSFSVGRSWSQEGGAIIQIRVNGREQPNLWVESETKVISFFPY